MLAREGNPQRGEHRVDARDNFGDCGSVAYISRGHGQLWV